MLRASIDQITGGMPARNGRLGFKKRAENSAGVKPDRTLSLPRTPNTPRAGPTGS